MADVFSRAKRREIMQKVRRERTEPEERLAKELKGYRLRCRRNPAGLPGKPDFYFPRIRLVVFVHGCFWHGHTACNKGRTRPKTRTKYWEERIAKNRRRDRRVARQLRERGLSVYTVWECELRRGGLPLRLKRRLLLRKT